MKKVYIIILLLIICFALTIAAWAEEIYADIAELWNENWGMEICRIGFALFPVPMAAWSG